MNASSIDPLDTDRVQSARDTEEHRLTGLVVYPLHDRQRCLALVEAAHDHAAKTKELHAQSIGTSAASLLNEANLLEARKQSVDRAARLLECRCQIGRTHFALISKAIENSRGLVQHLH